VGGTLPETARWKLSRTNPGRSSQNSLAVHVTAGGPPNPAAEPD